LKPPWERVRDGGGERGDRGCGLFKKPFGKAEEKISSLGGGKNAIEIQAVRTERGRARLK